MTEAEIDAVVKGLWPIERRILGYLDNHCVARREEIVCDISSPNSRIGQGHLNGSNGGTPRIMGSWARRLVKAGLIEEVRDRDGFYKHHAITLAGRTAIRAKLLEQANG